MEACPKKEGDVLKYNGGSTNKWEKYHAVLSSDSQFCWYEKLSPIHPLRWCNGSYRLRGSVLLSDVVPYICVGLMTDRMPVNPPELPLGYSVHHLVGIGMDPDAETVHWILFSSDAEIDLNPPKDQNLGLGSPKPSEQSRPSKPPIHLLSSLSLHQNLIPDLYPATSISDGGQVEVKGDAPPPYYNQRQDGNDEGRQRRLTLGSRKININKGGGVDNGGGRNVSAHALGRRLLGFGTAMLAGSLVSYGFGSMWHDETDEEEGGYHSDSDTDGDVDYLDFDDPTQSQQATSVIGNDDDDQCHAADADSSGLDYHVADSDGFSGACNDDFGGGDDSGGETGGFNCGED